MTVGELKRMLDDYDEDMKIVFQPSGDMYGEYIGYIEEGKGIASFRGNDYRALILTSELQMKIKVNIAILWCAVTAEE